MPLRLFGVTLQNGQTALPAGVELIGVRDLAAAVEPAAAAGDVKPADLERHHRVIQSLFQEGAVLPAPVGTVFASDELLQRWLDLHYVMLSDALAWVEHRLGARVHVKRPGNGVGPASAPLAVVLADVVRQLRSRAVAIETLPSANAAVASAAFLVEGEHWQAFAAAAGELGRKVTDAQIDVTGPWPPYDFVRLRFAT